MFVDKAGMFAVIRQNIHYSHSRLYREKQAQKAGGTFVLYWMQQAQRACHNPALDFARQTAAELHLPLHVAFVFSRDIPDAQTAHYRFMLEGIAQTGLDLKRQNIGFHIMVGNMYDCIRSIADQARVLVFDHGYLSWQRAIRDRLFDSAALSRCDVYEIDTEAVVPVHLASSREEYSAATLRRKILAQLSLWLSEKTANSEALPAAGAECTPKSEYSGSLTHSAELWNWVRRQLNMGAETGPAYLIKSGSNHALDTLKDFITHHLQDYATLRNHPNLDIQSCMSPYLHFGQISPIQIIGQICEDCNVPVEATAELIGAKAGLQGTQQSIGAFAEELIIRRELAMNFCYYNPDYESSSSLPDWARKTLNDHLSDPREEEYSLSRLELAESSDIYWNAAQLELMHTGKMHNYMRMYWGKRVLAWCPSVDEAYSILAYLNNKYELDGRDANGWAGIAWCFGKHDRPWASRPIYGMVRYMNAAGLKRKFDMKAYIDKWH